MGAATAQTMDVGGASWRWAWRRGSKAAIKDMEFTSSVTVSAQGEGVPGDGGSLAQPSPGCQPASVLRMRGLAVVTDKTLWPWLSPIAAHERPTLTKAALLPASSSQFPEGSV